MAPSNMNKKHVITVIGLSIVVFMLTNWVLQLTPLYPSNVDNRREVFFHEYVDNYSGDGLVFLCHIEGSYTESGWPYLISQSNHQPKDGSVADVSSQLSGCPEVSSTKVYRFNELLNYLIITASITVLTGGYVYMMSKIGKKQ